MTNKKGQSSLKDKILSGELIIGMSDHTGSEVVVEIMGMVGFDFVWIDTEHTSLSMETVEKMIRAADSAGVPSIVRVGKNDPHIIMQALDSGAKGIVIPQIRTAKDALQAIEATRYPPEGKKGMCPGVRGAGYLLENWDSYWPKSNREVVVAVIIENEDAVANLPDILSVPGIDLIIPGPGDYSQELGLPINHPKVEKVMKSVIDQSLSAGKQVMCILLGDLESITKYLTFNQLKRYYNLGARGFLFCNDVLLWAQLCKDLTKSRSKVFE